jgi:hypothetical protein
MKKFEKSANKTFQMQIRFFINEQSGKQYASTTANGKVNLVHSCTSTFREPFQSIYLFHSPRVKVSGRLPFVAVSRLRQAGRSTICKASLQGRGDIPVADATRASTGAEPPQQIRSL